MALRSPGNLASMMRSDKAMPAYEAALWHNPFSAGAFAGQAGLHKEKEQYSKTVEAYTRSLQLDSNNGRVWSELGHCHLLMDDMQKAYTAYQQASYHLPQL